MSMLSFVLACYAVLSAASFPATPRWAFTQCSFTVWSRPVESLPVPLGTLNSDPAVGTDTLQKCRRLLCRKLLPLVHRSLTRQCRLPVYVNGCPCPSSLWGCRRDAAKFHDAGPGLGFRDPLQERQPLAHDVLPAARVGGARSIV
ncbi:hypothetical protein AVEN_164559-1 [Araneus ventricosus]|uniref:Secreted protein n=1 Tax=Araneus ventricosus TaxID=182803 RepID=A0A4Y2B4K1_ARAVE|nr:hypothetical protein AVEN_164559-1 [Araneus ventricosus]